MSALTLLLAAFDAETRFLLRAERGQGKTARGIALLEQAKGKATRAVSKKK